MTLATPDALVTADGADSVAEAPAPGAEKFTVTPLSGLPWASLTVACKGELKAVLTGVLCGVPLLATTEAAAAVELVREKIAGVETPETLAVTE